MKDIIPLRIVIALKEDGTYKDALLFYKIRLESGEIKEKTYSISIKSKISVPIISGMISESKDFTEKQEKKFIKMKGESAP